MHARFVALSPVIAALTALAVPAAPARAESNPVAPRLDLELGAHWMLSPESACQRDSDVVGCSGQGFLGAQAAVIYRPVDRFSLGPSIALGGQPGREISAGGWDAHDVQMWRLALEGRYHVGARTRAGLYLAASAGAAFMAETRTLGPREASVTQSGALLGAAVGYSFALPFGLGAAVSLRGYYTFMSDNAPDLGSADYEAHAWGALPWIGLAVDATLGGEL